MMDTEMKSLRCGTEDHEPMDRLLENRDPLGPLGRVAFTLWICQACGVMALHLETPGDIYWYRAFEKTTMTHQGGCAYCQAKFACACGAPGARHMCPRCDGAAEESKVTEPPYVSADALAAARSPAGPIYPEHLHPREMGGGSTDDC